MNANLAFAVASHVPQLQMESVEHSDKNPVFLPRSKFCDFREQEKFIDLLITVEEGECVKAHRIILATAFPFILNSMTSAQNDVAFQWKGFSKDTVEAIVNYAYTGKITITTGNATRLCLLAHHLGSKKIVSWCAAFLKTRISIDNVVEIWSVANITMNRRLIELCIPLMSGHLEDLCLPPESLMQTTVEQLEMLLEDERLEGVSEEGKYRVICKWLEAGMEERDLEEREEVFTRLLLKIDLKKLSPKCRAEFWTFVRGYSGLLQAGSTLPSLRVNAEERLTKQRSWLVPKPRPPTKEVLLLLNRGEHSSLYALTTQPQLRPDRSLILTFPSDGAATTFDGKLCIVTCAGAKSNMMLVNHQDGSIAYKYFYTNNRWSYGVASRDGSIFIFGGSPNNHCSGSFFATCERFDTAINMLVRLPDLPIPRSNVSALNIPDVGIIVVGGYRGGSNSSVKSNDVELLVQDNAAESDWRWIKLEPMLHARQSPAVASFKGHVVVVGGDEGSTAECLPLSSIKQAKAGWTRLRGICEQNTSSKSLVTFNDRLLLLSSSNVYTNVYEFLPSGKDQSLANYKWKPLFRLDGLQSPMLFVAREKQDEDENFCKIKATGLHS